MMRHRFGWVLWVALIVSVVALFFHESLFQNYSLIPTDVLHHFLLPYGPKKSPIDIQNHYPIDEVSQTYPAGVFWQASVKNGEVPLWNPYIYGGHPQLATSIWGILCPTKLLHLLCSAERAHTLGMLLQFFLAGVFMMVFLRELGQSPWAAFLGSCAYAFNSQFFMAYWLWLNVFAWVPLVFFLFERSVRRNSWGYSLAAGLALTVPLISGSIQMTFFVGFLCGFYALASLSWRPIEQRRQASAQLVALFGIATLGGAIQFLPTLELLPREVGGRIFNSDQGAMGGLRHILLGIPALVTLIFPSLAGSPQSLDILKVFKGTMMHFSGYIGIIPFLLFTIGAQLKGEKRIRALSWLVLVVLVVVFFTPFLRFVYHRFFTVAIFAMSILAGYGFDAVLENSAENTPKIRRSFILISLIAILVAIGLLASQWYAQTHYSQLLEAGQDYIRQRLPTRQFKAYPDWVLARVPRFLAHFSLSNPLFWVPLLSVLGASLAWITYARGKMNRNVFAGLLALLTVCDLGVLGRSWVPQVDLAKYPLYPPVEVLAKAESDHDLFRICRWMPSGSLTLMDNVLMAYGLSSVGGYESLFPENMTAFTNQMNGEFNSLLDLQNAKYVLTENSVSLPAERFELVTASEGVRLYRNKTCMPRSQFVSDWQVLADRKQMLAQMHSGTFDPRKTVFLEEAPPMKVQRPPGQASSEDAPTVVIEKYSAQKVVAKVQTSTPGMVLLADTWYPGWKARLDGQQTKLFRADYVLKAVYTPAGEHVIEYYFAPASFRIGAAISLLTFTGAICCGLIGCFRARKCRRQPIDVPAESSREPHT